jgi:hypothetical protein
MQARGPIITLGHCSIGTRDDALTSRIDESQLEHGRTPFLRCSSKQRIVIVLVGVIESDIGFPIWHETNTTVAWAHCLFN